MSIERKVIVPIEVTLYEPEDMGDGRSSWTTFLLIGGGKWTDDEKGESYDFGSTGGGYVAYLPGDRAIRIEAKELIKAGLSLIKEGP